MQKVGRQFLIFPKWRVVVDPGTVDLTVNTADLNVTINGIAYATTDGNNYTSKLNHLYPGTYILWLLVRSMTKKSRSHLRKM